MFMYNIENRHQTSIAQTTLGPWKFVLDMGSQIYRWLIVVPALEAKADNLGMSFRSSFMLCTLGKIFSRGHFEIFFIFFFFFPENRI